jgi:cytochrome P450 family 6
MDEFLSTTLVILASLLAYLCYRYLRIYSYWSRRGVPHPTPLPFFGNTFSVTCGSEPLFEFHLKHYVQYDDSQFSGYYDFERPVLVVRDPDLINRVLTKDFAFFQDRGFPYDEAKEPLTANLFNMSGQRWKNVRIKATSCFTTQKRKLMFSLIENLVKGLKDVVDSAVEQHEEIEIKDILAR